MFKLPHMFLFLYFVLVYICTLNIIFFLYVHVLRALTRDVLDESTFKFSNGKRVLELTLYIAPMWSQLLIRMEWPLLPSVCCQTCYFEFPCASLCLSLLQ